MYDILTLVCNGFPKLQAFRLADLASIKGKSQLFAENFAPRFKGFFQLSIPVTLFNCETYS